jgi:SAM-dependent methyltransferase
MLPQDVMDALYDLAYVRFTNPEPISMRRDWVLVGQWINGHCLAGARVLDVGCDDGRFLESLGSGFELRGIEINHTARRLAEKRGVLLVAESINRMPKRMQTNDAVVAIDIIEHIAFPTHFFRQLSELAAPKGYIIITTGNTDAPAWRFMGSHYWYCCLAPHITFYNRRWFENMAEKHDLKLIASYPYSHCGFRPFIRRSVELIKNVMFRLILTFAYPLVWNRLPPAWVSATDHLMLVFQKR